MLRRTYGFLGSAIAVESEQAAVLDWLDEFLTPLFERCEGIRADVSVVIRTDRTAYDRLLASRPFGPLLDVPCFALDQKVSRRSHWTVDGRMVLADARYESFYVLAGNQVDVVTGSETLRYRTGAMRVICEIAATRALGDRNRMQVHAAAIERGGRALLLAGPKTAGKTTLLSCLAAAGCGGIMANDRSLLSFASEAIEVRAVPTTVKVRPFTVECLPGRFPDAARSHLRAFLTLAEVAAGARTEGDADPRGDLKLSPAQFAQALGARLSSRAHLAAVLFPIHGDPDSGVSIEPLTRSAAEQRLLQSRFGIHSGKTGPTVFEQYMATPRCGGEEEELIPRLAAAVPCYAVRIGARAYAQSATAERVMAAVLPDL